MTESIAPRVQLQRDGYEIHCDPDRIDVSAVHGYLTTSYWANGISREVVDRAIRHSIPFGVLRGAEHVGFARVVTDRATFAYLADVYIDLEHRGRGLSKWLLEVIQAHPALQGLRRWALATRDAHGLYAQFGFTPLSAPERFMEKLDRDVYRPTRPARG